MSQQNLLQNVYLFKELNAFELSQIESTCQVMILSPGDEVFNQGDVATCLYIIHYGSVKITQKGHETDAIDIATLGTGSHFGEMAFVDAEVRSASVLTVEKTELVKIDYATLHRILDLNPITAVKIFRAMAHFLCGRLRVTTMDLSYSREMHLRHF